jgi:hypothetical protein
MKGFLKKHTPAVLIVGLIVGYVLYQHFSVREGLVVGPYTYKDGIIIMCSDSTEQDVKRYGTRRALVDGDTIRRIVAANFGGVTALAALTGNPMHQQVKCKDAPAGPDITSANDPTLKVAIDKIAAAKAATAVRMADVEAKIAADKAKAAADKIAAAAIKAEAETVKAAADNQVVAAKSLEETTKDTIEKDKAELNTQVMDFAYVSKYATDSLEAAKKKLSDKEDAFQTGMIVVAGVVGIVVTGGLVYSMTKSPTPTTGAGRRRR